MGPVRERAGMLRRGWALLKAPIRHKYIHSTKHESDDDQAHDGDLGALAHDDTSGILSSHQGRMLVAVGRAAACRFAFDRGRRGIDSVDVRAKVMNVAEDVLVFIVLDSVVGDAHLRALPLCNAVLGVANEDTPLNRRLSVGAQRRETHPLIVFHDTFAHFEFRTLLAQGA